MNRIKVNFNGFRIQVKDLKYAFPIENWDYENDEQLSRLDQLNFNFENVRSDHEKHKVSGKVTSINLSEKNYQTVLNMASSSLQKLRVAHLGSDIKILYDDVPVKAAKELDDKTIGVSSFGSV